MAEERLGLGWPWMWRKDRSSVLYHSWHILHSAILKSFIPHSWNPHSCPHSSKKINQYENWTLKRISRALFNNNNKKKRRVEREKLLIGWIVAGVIEADRMSRHARAEASLLPPVLGEGGFFFTEDFTFLFLLVTSWKPFWNILYLYRRVRWLVSSPQGPLFAPEVNFNPKI